MASRNDLVYDEDDYVPPGYLRPKPVGGRRRVLLAVVVVGLVVGAFVVSQLMRSRVRARDEEIMRAHVEQTAMIEARRSGLTRSLGKAGEEVGVQTSMGWSKLLGTWSRMPEPDEVSHYPIRFEFRSGRPSVVTQADNRSIEVTIRVCRESVETIELDALPLVQDPFHRPRQGFYHGVYRFTFKSNGSILLDDMMGGLEFTRDDTPINPARSGMPPR
jgi:hypothetical protein